MSLFSFDPSKGETPQSLRAKREIAQALIGSRAPAKNVGEGLGQLGNAIAFRLMQNKIDKGQADVTNQANTAFQPILQSLMGTGAPQPSAGAVSPPSSPVAPPAKTTMPTGIPRAGEGAMAAQADAAQVRPSTPAPEISTVPPSPPSGNWLAYDNKSAIRNQPLNPKLAESLSFLPEMGVSMRVFSGGQDAEGPNRTGSHRHDHGNAGDVFFERNGKRLDWRNEADIPVLQQVVSRARANGVTGFGAGDGYMQPGSMHIGFGSPAVWGNGGKGDNAPEWLRQAFNTKYTPQGQPAPVQVASNDAAQSFQQPTPQVQPAGGGQPQLDAATLAAAMNNPAVQDNPSMMGMLNMLMQQEMQKRDPAYQTKAKADELELEKLRLELDQIRNPRAKPAEPFTLNPGDVRFDGNGKKIATGGEKPPTLPAGVQEYEYAKGQGFKGTFQDWEASKKGGMQLSVDPTTGAVTFQQGGNIKPMTEAQSKDVGFATRAKGALETLDGQNAVADSLTDLIGSTLGQIPGVGNYMKSDNYQKAEQAGREFMLALLRKDSGGAITADEDANYGAVYLPRPGDGEGVIAQKKVARERALRAIEAGMPPQAILAQEKALAKTAGPSSARAGGVNLKQKYGLE